MVNAATDSVLFYRLPSPQLFNASNRHIRWSIYTLPHEPPKIVTGSVTNGEIVWKAITYAQQALPALQREYMKKHVKSTGRNTYPRGRATMMHPKTRVIQQNETFSVMVVLNPWLLFHLKEEWKE
jgi:hypothetical protein